MRQQICVKMGQAHSLTRLLHSLLASLCIGRLWYTLFRGNQWECWRCAEAAAAAQRHGSERGTAEGGGGCRPRRS